MNKFMQLFSWELKNENIKMAISRSNVQFYKRSLIKIADYKKKPVGSANQVFFLRTLILTNLFQISNQKKNECDVSHGFLKASFFTTSGLLGSV